MNISYRIYEPNSILTTFPFEGNMGEKSAEKPIFKVRVVISDLGNIPYSTIFLSIPKYCQNAFGCCEH